MLPSTPPPPPSDEPPPKAKFTDLDELPLPGEVGWWSVSVDTSVLPIGGGGDDSMPIGTVASPDGPGAWPEAGDAQVGPALPGSPASVSPATASRTPTGAEPLSTAVGPGRPPIADPWRDTGSPVDPAVAPDGFAAAAAASPRVQDLGALPMRFEANAGQADAAAPFVSRGSGYNLFVNSSGLTLVLAPAGSGEAGDPRATQAAVEAAGAAGTLPVHRLTLVSSKADAAVEGYDPLSTVTNYFRGDDPAAWQTNVANFSGVAVRGVYPGIDLLVHGSAGGRLEYDFAVSPGADPSQIRYTLPGADAVSVDESGNLTVSVGGGTVRHEAPVLYQEEADGKRTPVAGRYALDADGTVGFEPGAYDRARRLVVDPILNFSGFLGGSSTDNGYAVAVGNDGSTYVTGSTLLSGFPSTGTIGATGSTDAFVARVSPSGSSLIYSTILGGTGTDIGYGIAVDNSGFSYVVGSTTGGFPTATPFQGSFGGGATDGFLTSLNPLGGLRSSSYIGGGGTDVANGVAVDAAGYAYVVGSTTGVGFPLTSPAQPAFGGATDAFIVGVTPGGSTRSFSTYLGGSAADVAYGVAVVGGGGGAAVAVTGSAGTGFPTTAGAYDTTFGGGAGTDAFLAWYSGSGAKQYATYLGGSTADVGRAVILREDRSVAVAGSTAGAFPTSVGAAQTSYGGGATDAFLSWFNYYVSGGSLIYSTYLGGSGADVGYGVANDFAAGFYLVGSTGGGLVPSADAVQGTYGGGTDAFVARLALGQMSTFGYLTYLGGTASDTAYGVAANRFQAGLASVTGSTSSSTFPTLYPVGSYGGGSDAFVSRFGPGIPAPRITGVTSDTGSSASDLVTNDTSLTVSGVAVAGSTVTLYRAGVGPVGTTTASGSGTWSIVDSTVLPDGTARYTAVASLAGASSAPSAESLVLVDTAGPSVGLTVPATTYDTTPAILVTASDAGAGPTGTFVLDVDLNNDNDFSDPSETGYLTGTLAGGMAYFELVPALAIGTYHLRSRALDRAGNEGYSSTQTMAVVTDATPWYTSGGTGGGGTTSGGGTSGGGTSGSRTGGGTGEDPGPNTPGDPGDDPGDTLLTTGGVRVSVSLDLDASPGTVVSRNPGLGYDSASIDVHPIIPLDIRSDSASALPPSVVAVLTWDGSIVATTTYSTSGRSPGDELLLAMQVPTAQTGVGRHIWSVQVTMDYTSSPDVVRTLTGQTFVAARDDSPYGAGWTFTDADRLYSIAASGGYPAGVLRVFGQGGWAFYEDTGSGSYTEPAGDAGTLVASGGGWVYTDPAGNTRTFNASGLQTARTSRDSTEQSTYVYTDGDSDGQSDDVRTVSYPDGAIATFAYSSNHMQTVTAGTRVTSFAYLGSDLAVATYPDGGLHTFTYSGHRVTGEALAGITNSWGYANGLVSTVQAGTAPVSTVVPAISRGLGTLEAGPRTATVTDPLGAVTRYRFDQFGNVTGRIAADGGSRSWTRDAAGRSTSYVDELGRATAYTRDGSGFVTRVDYADGAFATYAYAGFHDLTGSTDELGRRSSFVYDGSGHLTRSTDPAGGSTTYTWSGGLLQTVQDPIGRVSTYTYDAARRVRTQVDPTGATLTYSYDASGNLATVADPLGRLTSSTYDPVGRVIVNQDGLGARTTYLYDAAGLVRSVVDPLGRVVTYTYDARGLVQTQLDPTGAVTSFGYDASGRLITTTDPLLRATTFAYDSVGRLVAVVDPAGGRSTTVYDLAGQVTATIDPTGIAVRYGYDARRRVVSMTDALNSATTTVYDAAGQVTASVDPLNRRTSFTYDLAGRVETVKDPTGAVSSTVYDAAGQVKASVDPLNRRTSFTYDLAGRVETVKDPTGAVATTVYDAAGQVKASVDPLNRRTSYTYDLAGRIETVKDPTGAVATTVYDATGQVTASVDPLNRRTSYTYDLAGRVTAVQDPTGARSTTTYDPAGQAIIVEDPLNRQTGYAYDLAGRTFAVVDAAGGASAFLYDAAGRLTATVDPLGRVSVSGYDLVGRPITTANPLGAVVTTVYDSVGQVTASVDPLGRQTSYSYDLAGRVIDVRDAVGILGTTMYDAAGQVTASVDPLNRRTSFTYDLAGRVETVKDPTGAVSSTVYDAAGQVKASVDPLNRRTSFTYDLAGRVETVKDPTGAVATTVYDAAGQVTASVNARGFRTSYTYDLAGRVQAVKDAAGGVSSTVYDAAGQVTASVNARGFRTSYTYDLAGRLTETKDTFLHVATTSYDAAGQVVVSVDALGRRTSFAYDLRGRNVQTTDANGGLSSTAYDPADQTSASVDPLGRRTSYTYDLAGRVETVKDPTGAVSSTVYDAAGQIKASVDPLNRRTSYTYDLAGRVETVKDPTGAVSSTVYDAAGQVTAAVNARGFRTSYTYDLAGRVQTVKDALGGVATSAYDAVGNVTATTNPRGFATSMTYDALDRVTEVKDPTGAVATTVYDLNGNVTASVDPLGRRTSYAYDALDRRIAETNPLGKTTTTGYDWVGNVRTVTDPLNHTTSYVYDNLNRRIAEADALAKATTTIYDAAGQVTAIVDPVGNRTSYTYDGNGRVLTAKQPTGGVTTTAYDAAGQVSSVADPTGRTTTYAYDGVGRNRGETWKAPGGAVTDVRTYVYDLAGNQTVSANGAGTYTTTFDELDRASVVKEPFGVTLTFAYDAAGNRTRVQDIFGGVTTSGYDAVNRLTSRVVGGTSAVSRVDYAYDAAGQLGTMTYASDLAGATVVARTTYAYDGAGRTTGITKRNAGGTVLASYAYQFDDAGRKTAKTENGVLTTFTYDDANQLTFDGGVPHTYDGNGNRSGSGYAVGAGNRVTTDGVWTYTYDAAGAVTGKSDGAGNAWAYGYDNAGHMLTAVYTLGGGAVAERVTYAYDTFGNLLKRDYWNGSTTVTTKFGFDGWDTAKPFDLANEEFDAVWELDGSNALLVRRVYGAGFDDAAARVTGSTVEWYGTDDQGSVRQVLSPAGVVTGSFAFGAFGEVLSGSPTDWVGYTGGTYDPVTNLVLLGDRWYNPETGTWQTPDRLGFAAGPNLREYVGNSPTNGTDPSGMIAPVGFAPAAGVGLQSLLFGPPPSELEAARQRELADLLAKVPPGTPADVVAGLKRRFEADTARKMCRELTEREIIENQRQAFASYLESKKVDSRPTESLAEAREWYEARKPLTTEEYWASEYARRQLNRHLPQVARPPRDDRWLLDRMIDDARFYVSTLAFDYEMTRLSAGSYVPYALGMTDQMFYPGEFANPFLRDYHRAAMAGDTARVNQMWSQAFVLPFRFHPVTGIMISGIEGWQTGDWTNFGIDAVLSVGPWAALKGLKYVRAAARPADDAVAVVRTAQAEANATKAGAAGDLLEAPAKGRSWWDKLDAESGYDFFGTWKTVERYKLQSATRVEVLERLTDRQIVEISEFLRQEVSYRVFKDASGNTRVFVSVGKWDPVKGKHTVTAFRPKEPGWELLESTHAHPTPVKGNNVYPSPQDVETALKNGVPERIVSRNPKTHEIDVGGAPATWWWPWP